MVVAVLWLAWCLLRAPATFENAWGFAPEGRAFTTLLEGIWRQELWSPDAFALAFRGGLAVAWAGWLVLLVWAARPQSVVSVRAACVAVVGTSALVTIAFPPALSRDVLGYVAYGRVLGVHGLNPYLHGRQALETLGDPSAAFLVWNTPLPYGPLWVLFAAAVAVVGHITSGLWLELFLHKAAAAFALIIAAVTGADMVERRRPGARALAILVIGLNPLLLIEGPGTGHNDVSMTSLLVVAAALSTRNRPHAMAFVAGLATAVKPVALAALPILVTELWWRGARWQQLLRVGALSLLPTWIMSYTFGGPAVLIESVALRATSGIGNPPIVIAIALCGAALLVATHLRLAVTERVAGAWLVAWIPAAVVVGVIVMPINFPWYTTWALLPALTRLDHHGVPYLTLSTVLAGYLMWQYTVPV